MSIPGLGDAITLFDLSIRVTTFINDLRHAQDDFISLRSEADCLRICLGSLTSDSCQNALYHYITEKQGQDLEQIVDNCKFNMMDLNTFIAKCAKLGIPSSSKQKGLVKSIGQFLSRATTKFKFVMTDKQAFRDKLVLPTASINVFLTSLTHVGLVNMGRIMIMTGHGNAIPTESVKDDGKKTGVDLTVSAISGWQAVGERIAFRDTIVKRSDVTASFEEEILEYALHLLRGGLPFYVKTGRTTGTRQKVTKTTSTRTRSRSRSTGPLGLGKGGRGQKYVVRKKSVSRPFTDKVESVEREWESGSESDRPGKPLLALPAPPVTSSSRNYVEIKPASASDSNEATNEGDHRKSERPYAGGTRSARREQHRRLSAHDADNAQTRRQPTTSREEIQSHRRNIRQEIRAEQEAAFRELEQEEQTYRARRARTRMSTSVFHSREEESEYRKEEEEEDVMAFLAEQYGLIIEPLPVPREPIDHGTVKDIPPPTANGHVESISDSEDSDYAHAASHSRSRPTGGRPVNDRLTAQTYRSPITFMPRTTRYAPYPDPRGTSRHQPGSRPYSEYYREPPVPLHVYGDSSSPIVVDERHSHPRHHGYDAPIVVDEQHSPPPRRPEYPPRHDPSRRSSDDSDHGMYETRGPRRGPGPGSRPSHEREERTIRANDEMSKHSKRKSALKHRPVILEHPQSYTDKSYNDEIRPRHVDGERQRSYNEDRYVSRRDADAQEISMRDGHKYRPSDAAPELGHDTYMRGARADDDSDDV